MTWRSWYYYADSVEIYVESFMSYATPEDNCIDVILIARHIENISLDYTANFPLPIVDKRIVVDNPMWNGKAIFESSGGMITVNPDFLNGRQWIIRAPEIEEIPIPLSDEQTRAIGIARKRHLFLENTIKIFTAAHIWYQQKTDCFQVDFEIISTESGELNYYAQFPYPLPDKPVHIVSQVMEGTVVFEAHRDKVLISTDFCPQQWVVHVPVIEMIVP